MGVVSVRPPRPPAHFCWEPQVCIKFSWNFHSIIGKCIKINVVSVHFSVTTLYIYKTTFEVTDPPARASHHVMAMGGTVPYFIDLGNREMKSDWFKFRLRTYHKIEWTTHRLYKIEITLSIQAISQGWRIRGFDGARAPSELASAPSHYQKHPLKMKGNLIKHRSGSTSNKVLVVLAFILCLCLGKTVVVDRSGSNWTATSGKAPPRVSTILHPCY